MHVSKYICGNVSVEVEQALKACEKMLLQKKEKKKKSAAKC